MGAAGAAEGDFLWGCAAVYDFEDLVVGDGVAYGFGAVDSNLSVEEGSHGIEERGCCVLFVVLL